MKYKSLFRVLVKVIGVWMLGFGLAHIIFNVAIVTYYELLHGMPDPNSPWQTISLKGGADVVGYIISRYTYPLCLIIFGLILFFRPNWIANLAIPSNRPYCVECGYDLTGNAADRCPECGTVKPNGELL